MLHHKCKNFPTHAFLNRTPGVALLVCFHNAQGPC
jgi:hypothetical protein